MRVLASRSQYVSREGEDNRLQSRLGIGGLDVRLPDAILEGLYADSDVQMFSRRMPSTLWQIVVPV